MTLVEAVIHQTLIKFEHALGVASCSYWNWIVTTSLLAVKAHA